MLLEVFSLTVMWLHFGLSGWLVEIDHTPPIPGRFSKFIR
jgi:hypothetical protein